MKGPGSGPFTANQREELAFIVINDAPLRSVPTLSQRRHNLEGGMAPVPSRWMPLTAYTDALDVLGLFEQTGAAPVAAGVGAERKCHR